MHILLGTNTLEVGGIETNLVRLTRALTRLGHEVTVVSAGGALSQGLEYAGGVNVCLQMDLRSPGRIRQGVLSAAGFGHGGAALRGHRGVGYERRG
jgi:hypothetical protein